MPHRYTYLDGRSRQGRFGVTAATLKSEMAWQGQCTIASDYVILDRSQLRFVQTGAVACRVWVRVGVRVRVRVRMGVRVRMRMGVRVRVRVCARTRARARA